MSDLANALKMLANSISGGTTESVGNSGGSNSAISNEEVSVFERKTNKNVDFNYSSIDDEEFFWWQERLEKQETQDENIQNSSDVENISKKTNISTNNIKPVALVGRPDNNTQTTNEPSNDNFSPNDAANLANPRTNDLIKKFDNESSTELTSKLSEAKNMEDVYNVFYKFTNNDKNAARIMFNAMCQDPSFIDAMGGKKIYLDENMKMTIDGKPARMTQTESVGNKENIYINALFDYRNGNYIINESVLAQFSQDTYVYDSNGNITSGTDFYIGSDGSLNSVHREYSYDKNGNPTKILHTGINEQTGEITYKEESSFIEENGEYMVKMVRTSASGEIINESSPLVTIAEYQDIKNLQAIAAKYTDRTDLTYEELKFCETIDYQQKNNAAIKEMLLNQDYEEGIVSKTYNWFKEVFPGGATDRSDIRDTIMETNSGMKKMIGAINDPNLSFTDTYKQVYGVEYNQDAIDQTQILEAAVQVYTANKTQFYNNDAALSYYFAQGDLEQVKTMFDVIYNGNSAEANEMYEKYIAEQEFLTNINYLTIACPLTQQEGTSRLNDLENKEGYNAFAQTPMYRKAPKFPTNGDLGTYYDQRYEYVKNEFIKFYGEEKGIQKFEQMVGTDQSKAPCTNWNVSTVETVYLEDMVQRLDSRMKELGYDPNILMKNYMDVSQLAFGNHSQIEVTELVNSYIADQNSFIDRSTAFVQQAGTYVLVAGCVVALSAGPQGYPVAKGLLALGSNVSLAGLLGKSGLHAIDEATAKNCSREELGSYLKDFAIHAFLYASGRFIGKLSEGFNDIISNFAQSRGMSETVSKIIGKVGEVALDTVLSLGTDLVVTGECDVKSETFAQILGLIAGKCDARVEDLQTRYPSSLGLGLIPALKGYAAEIGVPVTSKHGYSPNFKAGSEIETTKPGNGNFPSTDFDPDKLPKHEQGKTPDPNAKPGESEFIPPEAQGDSPPTGEVTPPSDDDLAPNPEEDDKQEAKKSEYNEVSFDQIANIIEKMKPVEDAMEEISDLVKRFEDEIKLP